MAVELIRTFGSSKDVNTLGGLQPDLAGLKIYEAQSDGAIHSVLRRFPGYVCSEYFDEVPAGEMGPSGIRCEDLQALSFADETFDLVITQDVLEHVREPYRALGEIRRVLKPGGYHLFTVPLNMSRMDTIPLVDVSSKEDRFPAPAVYHRDSIRLEGTLVYNDFGMDLLTTIDSQGMETRTVISDTDDERRFAIFQSHVFISRRLP